MLNQKKCVPCQGGIDPLNPSEISKFISKIDEGWQVKDNKKIEKEYVFSLFVRNNGKKFIISPQRYLR